MPPSDPVVSLREPVGRLLTYLTEGELPPAATCTALTDQAEAIRRDNPESASAIAGRLLASAVQRARADIDAGGDPERAMDAIAPVVRLWSACARAGC